MHELRDNKYIPDRGLKYSMREILRLWQVRSCLSVSDCKAIRSLSPVWAWGQSYMFYSVWDSTANFVVHLLFLLLPIFFLFMERCHLKLLSSEHVVLLHNLQFSFHTVLYTIIITSQRGWNVYLYFWIISCCL